jgi:hypothetical protein
VYVATLSKERMVNLLQSQLCASALYIPFFRHAAYARNFLQLFPRLLCSLNMKTFVTALLIVVGLAVLFHVAPVLLAPFSAVIALFVGLGGIMLGGMSAVLGTIFALLAILLAAGGSVLLALSPLWLPIVFLIWILRRKSTPVA